MSKRRSTRASTAKAFKTAEAAEMEENAELIAAVDAAEAEGYGESSLGSPESQTTSSTSALATSPVASALQKARAERNRQKALMLKRSRLEAAQSRSKPGPPDSPDKAIIRVEGVKFIDTGGGFLLEQKEGSEEAKKIKLVEDLAPVIEPDQPTCEECSTKFSDSFLMINFDHPVCDKCKDTEKLHALITKTDARNDYLLKDCDFDKREPPLRFLLRKNPHDPRWGDMKLYLQLQVEQRALEVWGTEEKLEEERELRQVKKEKAKVKKYNKQMKELRMSVRSSLYNRITSNHQHEFGPESYNAEEDSYSRTCVSCSYEESFEKM